MAYLFQNFLIDAIKETHKNGNIYNIIIIQFTDPEVQDYLGELNKCLNKCFDRPTNHRPINQQDGHEGSQGSYTSHPKRISEEQEF